jgi:hypothetical protein
MLSRPNAVVLGQVFTRLSCCTADYLETMKPCSSVTEEIDSQQFALMDRPLRSMQWKVEVGT